MSGRDGPVGPPRDPLLSIARTKRPAIQPTLELTLGDLLSTVEPERYPAAVGDRLRELWPRALEHLGPGDLHFLIGQGIGASLVVPLALELLERDPLLVAVSEPGDLLAAVFGAALPHVTAREHLRGRARAVLDLAARRLSAAGGGEPLLTLVGAAADALRSVDPLRG
jgi:hypothetical protein